MSSSLALCLVLILVSATPLSASTPSDLNNAGLDALKRADYPAALSSFEALAELLVRSGAEGTKDYSTALHNLGVAHSNLGNLEQSLDFLQKCHALRVRLLGRRHIDVAGVLANLGLTQLRLGDYTSESNSLEESLSQFRWFRGETHAQVANGWRELGVLRLEMGDLPRARECLDRALAVGTEIGEPVIETCRTRFNLGELSRFEGDAGEAEQIWLATLAVAEEHGLDEIRASLYDGLGAICSDDGRHDAARKYLEQALELRRRMSSKTYEANTMMLLGELALRSSHFDDGRSWFAQSAAAMRDEQGARSPRVARIECSRGELELSAGETPAATAAFRRALDAMQVGDVPWRSDSRQLRPHFNSAFAAGGLSRCLATPKDADELLAMCELTLELHARYRRSLSRAGRERGDAFLDTAVPYILALLARRASMGDGLDGDRVCRIADMANALAFLERMSEARVDFAGALPSAWQMEEEEIRERLERPASGTGADAAATLLAAELDLQRFADRLHIVYPRLAALRYPRPATLGSIQSVLSDDEVVLSYLVSPQTSWILAIRADTFSLQKLPEEAVLADAVQALRHALRDGTDAAPSMRRLHEMLIEPVRLARSARRIALVASGILEGVPFEGLIDSAGVVLGDRVSISYQPSLAILRLLRLTPNRRNTSGGTTKDDELLAIGNAVYDSAVQGVLSRKADATARAALRYSDSLRARWTSLPGTEYEIRSIAAIFRGSAKSVLLGADATEKRLNEADWSRFRYLHFACHGALEDGPGRAPALVLGLVGNVPPDDGFLMIDEIVSRPNTARVAVLSACQTGLSAPRLPRNGVASMARAFLLSGSDAVVVSLWPVSDNATAKFMVSFYRALIEKKESPGEALRTARRELRSDPRWSHPSFWAPFVLVGLDR